MTHHRLNQPTAYSPVPGAPINPSLEEPAMTTQTKSTAEQQAREMIERCGIRYADAMQLTASDVVELANLIVLHDELVAASKDLTQDFLALIEAVGEAIGSDMKQTLMEASQHGAFDRMVTLLARCQQT